MFDIFIKKDYNWYKQKFEWVRHWNFQLFMNEIPA